MKKLVIAVIAAICMVSFQLKAQPYSTALGIRIGIDNGITVKHFLNDKNAVEGIVAFYKGINVTGLYEWQMPKVFKVDQLDWYFGVGAHVGFWDKSKEPYNEEDGGTQGVIGVDGVIGLEYNFAEVPIGIGLDARPIVNLIGDDGFWIEAGLSVRYNFK